MFRLTPTRLLKHPKVFSNGNLGNIATFYFNFLSNNYL
uniref:Uncharacterized protein n=1 Tax=Anguilla anguilla TaxID=7936 RepID=A0A0E9Q940_ANGAN